MNSHEVFIHIHQGCFAGTGAIVRLPQCQWSKPDWYEKISQCITTTKHSKAKTVCIFLGIYCTLPAQHKFKYELCIRRQAVSAKLQTPSFVLFLPHLHGPIHPSLLKTCSSLVKATNLLTTCTFTKKVFGLERLDKIFVYQMIQHEMSLQSNTIKIDISRVLRCFPWIWNQISKISPMPVYAPC